jgi:hypothetical protein
MSSLCAGLGNTYSVGSTKLLGFERFNILKAIGNPTANLEVTRSLVQPAPTFQGAGADAPAAGQIGLVKMDDGHRGSPRSASNDCEDDRRNGGRKSSPKPAE